MNFYSSKKEDVLSSLSTDALKGLSNEKVIELRSKYGENKLKEKNLPEHTENYKVIKGIKDFDDVEKGEN